MRKLLFIVAGVMMASALMFGCSNPQKDEPKETEQAAEQTESADAADEPATHDNGTIKATADTVFGFPDQYDVKSGSGESLGTVAVFHASSDECTRENLETWCNQYVRWGLDNWCVIEFTDQPGYGVYAMGGMVEVGVQLDPEYMLEDDSETTAVYFFDGDNPTENGTLS